MQCVVTNRSWGNFLQFATNKLCTVKILVIRKNQAISLQSHSFRKEDWYVISGEGTLNLDGVVSLISQGDCVHIGAKIKHRVTAKTDMQILEISEGRFRETDIKRYSDLYGREET